MPSHEPLVEFGSNGGGPCSTLRVFAMIDWLPFCAAVEWAWMFHKACIIVHAIRNTRIAMSTNVAWNWKSKKGRLGANLMTKHRRLNHFRGNLPLRRLIMTTPKTFPECVHVARWWRRTKDICLFCQHKQKKVNHQLCQNLSSCMTVDACAKVAVCITREDKRLLLEVRPSQAD